MGNLSPAAQRGFFCTRGTLAAGKLGHSPRTGAVVVGGDRERRPASRNRPDPISDSQGNRWVVRKAPSFAHGATYK
jgi:hypothetical protein